MYVRVPGSQYYVSNSTEGICYWVVEKIMKAGNTDVVVKNIVSEKLDLDNASAIG